MAKTLRYFLRSACPLLGVYLAFAALSVGGSWLSGSPDGVLGTYAAMMPMMGSMLSVGFAVGSDVYISVALSMGARRRWCFWSVEAVLLMYNLCAPVFTVLTNGMLTRMFGPDAVEGVILALTPKSVMGWLLLYLTSLLLGQAGLLAGRVQNTTVRSVLIVVMMLLSAVPSVMWSLLSDFGILPDTGAMAPWAPVVLAVLALGTAAMAVPVYQMLRKAVVRE